MNQPITLDKPLVLYDHAELSGHFKASAAFRLSGGDLGQGRTAFGIVTVYPGSRNVTLRDLRIDGSALNLHSTEWQINQVRGVDLPLCDDTLIVNTEIIGTPREAIYAAGVRGLEIHHTTSEHTESFLFCNYFTGAARRANSHVYVWGHCQHKNGRSYGIPGEDKSYVSVRDPRYFIGGNGINGFLVDSEIADFSCVGEYKGTLKLSASDRVRIVRCHGASMMLQGSVYFDLEQGPNEINGPHGQLPFPMGPPGKVSTDITFESCLMDPEFTLWRTVDDPLSGSNTLQLSYPQWNTKIIDCDFWWQPDARPNLQGGFSCAQLYRTGYPVEFRGNRFHKVELPPDTPQPIYGPGNLHGIAILEEPIKPDFWPSSTNADWRTVNVFGAA